MKHKIRISPVLGILGFLGVLGFFFSPFFCIFFGFFGFFFWGLLWKEQVDERLEDNVKRAAGIAARLYMVFGFFVLFALDKHIASEIVLLAGSIAYGLVMVLAPGLAYFLDKKG